MKTKTFILFSVIFLFAGCSKNVKTNFGELYSLSGHVKSIRQTSYKAVKKFGKIVQGERREKGFLQFDFYIIINKKGSPV